MYGALVLVQISTYYMPLATTAPIFTWRSLGLPKETSEMLQRMPHSIKVAAFVRSYDMTPSAKHVIVRMEFRMGEIPDFKGPCLLVERGGSRSTS